jgi:SAM-dependent methyltransferase
MAEVSEMDLAFLPIAREHLTRFLKDTALRLANESGLLLEIGSQEHFGAHRCFHNYSIETFDIVDDYNPTYVGDITRVNSFIPDGKYDCVVCMDVLEHTLDPFGAVRELRRILKDGGHLLVSAPLNFRIHGPIPDCWRFTEHGFKVLLRDFDIVEIDILEAPGRSLFPIHYNVLATCNKNKNTPDSELRFRFIT